MTLQAASFSDLSQHGLVFSQIDEISATLRNDNNQPVICFLIRWTFQDRLVAAPTTIDRGYMNWHEREQPVIGVKSSVRISFNELNNGGQTPIAASAAASLIGAIFADGTVIGPFPQRLTEELTGKWAAENEIYTAFLSKLDRSSQDDAFAYFAAKIDGAGYSAIFSNRRAVAKEILMIQETAGSAYAVQYVRGRMASLAVPELVVK